MIFVQLFYSFKMTDALFYDVIMDKLIQRCNCLEKEVSNWQEKYNASQRKIDNLTDSNNHYKLDAFNKIEKINTLTTRLETLQNLVEKQQRDLHYYMSLTTVRLD